MTQKCMSPFFCANFKNYQDGGRMKNNVKVPVKLTLSVIAAFVENEPGDYQRDLFHWFAGDYCAGPDVYYGLCHEYYSEI